MSERLHFEESLQPAVTRNASWQFFAFVFGAIAAIGFAFIDDIAEHRWLRLLIRVLFCGVLAYVTLFNRRNRNWLIGVLNRWNVEKP
jgi:hypothetical protein